LSGEEVNEILRLIEDCRSITIEYEEDGTPKALPYKGIRKGKIEEKEVRTLIKRRRSRRRLSKKLISLCLAIARRLLENKVRFNMIFGREEVTISFDLDHFIRLYKNRVVIAGFKDLNEKPVALVRELLENHGNVKILKPLK